MMVLIALLFSVLVAPHDVPAGEKLPERLLFGPLLPLEGSAVPEQQRLFTD